MIKRTSEGLFISCCL